PRHTPEEFESEGIQTATFDLKEPTSVKAALQGIDRLFSLVPFTPNIVENSTEILNAAQEAGVGYILRMSAIGADPDSEYALMQVQGTMDQAVIDSGIPSTIIRPNSFMQNYILYYGSFIKNEGTFYLATADGKSSFVHVNDVADVAAEILIDPTPHMNKIYDITGAKSLTNLDVAEIISAATEKSVTYVPIEEMMAQMGMMQMNLPDWVIEKMLSLHRFIKDGHATPVANTVIEIAGHEPISFERFAEDNVGAWK
ncbi:MAG: NAD(P)H-binding protein, partial [Candidatus Aminicenantes bacterium]|nr:NAD(P)H-binding protein [Candidatus Aminicenantes bacterium]